MTKFYLVVSRLFTAHLGLTALQHTHKLHWASKETNHFLRATLTKISYIKAFKINNIWIEIIRYIVILYEAQYLKIKTKGVLVSKRRKCREIAKCDLSKITETDHYSLSTSTKRQHFRTFNSYSISMVDYLTAKLAFYTKSGRRAVSVIVLKRAFCNFTFNILHLSELFFFSDVFYKEYYM